LTISENDEKATTAQGRKAINRTFFQAFWSLIIENPYNDLRHITRIGFEKYPVVLFPR